MQIVDLSHTIYDGMPHYVGSPDVVVSQLAELHPDGYYEQALHITSHTGTHIDAPAHLFTMAAPLDSLAPSQFVGRAFVLDCRGAEKVTLAMLQAYTEILSRVDFLLLCTAHSKHWKSEEYLYNFPVLTPDAASYLVSLCMKGLGIDAVSFDEVENASYPIHRILLGGNMILIENMRNLRGLCGKEFLLVAAPLKIRNSDGAPARVFALL